MNEDVHQQKAERERDDEDGCLEDFVLGVLFLLLERGRLDLIGGHEDRPWDPVDELWTGNVGDVRGELGTERLSSEEGLLFGRQVEVDGGCWRGGGGGGGLASHGRRGFYWSISLVRVGGSLERVPGDFRGRRFDSKGWGLWT